MCRTGLLFTSRFHRLTGSHREHSHTDSQPQAHAAPSTWYALCFCCLGNSWSSQQTPALRSPHPHSLSELNFFENPTPTLLWATPGFATLILWHCNSFVCLPLSWIGLQGQRLEVSSSPCAPLCAADSFLSDPFLTLRCHALSVSQQG